MDAETRARELLLEVAELVHAEIMFRGTLLLRFQTGRGPHQLDGCRHEESAVPALQMRNELYGLIEMSAMLMQYRNLGPAELRYALLRSNKLLMQLWDWLHWKETGSRGPHPRESCPARSAFLGKPDASLAWIDDMRRRNADVAAELRQLMDDHDTDRPPAGESTKE